MGGFSLSEGSCLNQDFWGIGLISPLILIRPIHKISYLFDFAISTSTLLLSILPSGSSFTNFGSRLPWPLTVVFAGSFADARSACAADCARASESAWL